MGLDIFLVICKTTDRVQHVGFQFTRIDVEERAVLRITQNFEIKTTRG